jgi:hypothetical protein
MSFMSELSNRTKILIGVGLLVLLGGGVVLWFMSKSIDPNAPPAVSGPIEPEAAPTAGKPSTPKDLTIEDPKRTIPSGGPRANPDYKPDGK